MALAELGRRSSRARDRTPTGPRRRRHLLAAARFIRARRAGQACAGAVNKPVSGLWNVTRSTRPASTSRVDDSGCGVGRPLTRSQAPLRLTTS
jgi:hypothetical protein